MYFGLAGALTGALFWFLKSRGLSGSPFRGNQSFSTPPSSSFPEEGAQRDAFILDKIRRGDFYAQWVPLTVEANGNTATFWVLGDALKVDGVRVLASAILEQNIADVLDASLLTPKLADLIFQKATIRLDPILKTPDNTMNATATMLRQSADIDQAIEAKGGDETSLVSTVGKHWTISNSLPANPGKAENYGFHHWGQKFYSSKYPPVMGAELKNPETGEQGNVIQNQGHAHGPTHSDYSQNVVLVSNQAQLNGSPVRLQDILLDPTKSLLVSHEGPLQTLRQPGSEELQVVFNV